ncbi:hypothetical protein HanIR_Chr01g0025591 [Helianthus annuus]|nr:hypothetical protein HanIR_Chr01g0025591 [Helianthus annuus]
MGVCSLLTNNGGFYKEGRCQRLIFLSCLLLLFLSFTMRFQPQIGYSVSPHGFSIASRPTGNLSFPFFYTHPTHLCAFLFLVDAAHQSWEFLIYYHYFFYL